MESWCKMTINNWLFRGLQKKDSNRIHTWAAPIEGNPRNKTKKTGKYKRGNEQIVYHRIAVYA